MNSGTDGRRAATSPGVRSIPMPMVLPTRTARPNATPSTRSRLPLYGGSPSATLRVNAWAPLTSDESISLSEFDRCPAHAHHHMPLFAPSTS